jgi:hypothetical protein
MTTWFPFLLRSAAFLLADDCAGTRIDLEFDQAATTAQQLDLVDPGFKLVLVFTFQFDINHVSRVFALNSFEDSAQRKYLACLHRLSGAVMVAAIFRHAATGAKRQQQGTQGACSPMATVACRSIGSRVLFQHA